MSKGNTLKTLRFGLLIGLVAAAGFALAQTVTDRLIGTWKLSLERSTFLDGEGESRDAPWLDRTWTFEVAGNALMVKAEITPTKGDPITSEYTLPIDGVRVPMENAPEGYTLAFERVDDNTFRLVTRTSITEIVDQFEISSDGQSMTHSVVGIEQTIGRFDRQDP